MAPGTQGRFASQRAVVTGATGGIGMGVAQRLVAEGASLVFAGLIKEDVSLAEDTLRSGGATEVWGVTADLSTEDGALLLLDAVRTRMGGVEVLINNAGGGVIAHTVNHTEETLRRTVDNNLWTTLRCTLALLPEMTANRYGRIVNVGAESVRNGLAAHSIYNAAKGGVHALAVGLAREYASTGVTVNVVAPSFTLTPEMASAQQEGTLGEDLLEAMRQAVELIPMGRPARVDEVASAVLYLASREASFITGQVLSVNGGSSMG